jgi:hypothetical protein
LRGHYADLGIVMLATRHEDDVLFRALQTYVARLYEKLGAANRAQALMAAMHHGLIQYQEDPSPSWAQPCKRARSGEPMKGTRELYRAPRTSVPPVTEWCCRRSD